MMHHLKLEPPKDTPKSPLPIIQHVLYAAGLCICLCCLCVLSDHSCLPNLYAFSHVAAHWALLASVDSACFYQARRWWGKADICQMRSSLLTMLITFCSTQLTFSKSGLKRKVSYVKVRVICIPSWKIKDLRTCKKYLLQEVKSSS